MTRSALLRARSRAAAIAVGALLAGGLLASPAAAHPAGPAHVVVPSGAAAEGAAATTAKTPAAKRAAFGRRVLAEASRHVGKPYVYGATGPGAFDCSGFVGYVYRQLGVSLPRDSYSQFAATQRIPASAAVPGDLIWIEGFGHVAIYAGGGMMYDAPRSGFAVGYRPIYGSYLAGRVRR